MSDSVEVIYLLHDKRIFPFVGFESKCKAYIGKADYDALLAHLENTKINCDYAWQNNRILEKARVEAEKKLAEAEAERDTQRTQTLIYFGQVKELAAKLAEAERRNGAALRAMKMDSGVWAKSIEAKRNAINNAIKELEKP